MTRGVKHLVVAASVAAAGCAAAPQAVEVRPIKNPSAKLRQGADGLADARGQLAIGNVGLALEGFRKVARQYPDNVEAVAGMAACYEQMNRFDLAEAKYEAALALAPRDPALLTALAGVLDRLGRRDAAAGVRAEVAQLAVAGAALDQTGADDEPETVAVRTALPAAASITVALPPPQLAAPAAVTLVGGQPVKSLSATAELRATPVVIDGRASDQITVRLPPARLADRADISLDSAPLAMRGLDIAKQTTVAADLSPDLPAAQLGNRAAVSVDTTPLPLSGARLEQARLELDLSSQIPAPRLSERAAVSVSAPQAPRLERLSLSEVALLTGSGPVWRGQVVERTPQKLTVRWVPLATAAARPTIRLLNAARWQGLAARNRSYLLDRGWRKIGIGDASQVRERSLVLYPAAHPIIGKRLAAQFGCRAEPVKGADEFLVLLGRDAALRTAQQRG